MKHLKNLFGALMLLVTALTLTGCGNGDNALEEIINGGGGSSTPKSAGAISYATTSLLRGSKDPGFTNALTLTGDGTISYASSNTSVATVDANGKVTPVAPGTVTITATVSDSESYTYSTKQATYTIELQEGYSYREWDTGTKKYETFIAPSANCELITSATITFDGSKRYIAIGNLNVANSIQVTAASAITLCDNAELNIDGRLYGNSLYISAQSEGDEMGELNVTTDTGTDGNGVIDFTSDLYIHGGKITAIATGNSNRLHGINGKIISIYGGDIKGQGNESSGYGNQGIYVGYPSGLLTICGGKVEGIGGNSTSTSDRAGDGISGKFAFSGDAIIIATGGNAVGHQGGYGLNTNGYPSTAEGNAQITATGGNSVKSGGIGMHLQGGFDVKENVKIIATGGDNTGTDGQGGTGSENGTLSIRDQVSLTVRGGNSTGSKNGGVAIYNNTFHYYGGTFTAIGGTKGSSGANDGRAIYEYSMISNKTAETITLERSNDGETWGGTFTISSGTYINGPDYRGVRKIN